MLDREYIKNIDLNPNFKIGKSSIDGNGVISTISLKYGEFINIAIVGKKCTLFGAYLNHSDNPTAKTIKGSDEVYRTYAIKNIKPGEEITVDYTVNKDLEQPEGGWKFFKEKSETDIQEEELDLEEFAANPLFSTGLVTRTPPDQDKETYINLLKYSVQPKKVEVKKW